MPVTVKASDTLKGTDKTAATSEAVIHQVELTRGLCIAYLKAAAAAVSPLMSDAHKTLFETCFLQEPDDRSRSAVLLVLNKTLIGVSGGHTVKLDQTPFAGRHSLHLPLHNFCDRTTYASPGRYSFDQRAWTYIHEATHLFAGTDDATIGLTQKLGLRKEKESPYLDRSIALKGTALAYREGGLGKRGALRNADSYAAFAVMLSRLTRGLFRFSVPLAS